MAGMVQVSMSAAFSADKVRAGTVPATEMTGAVAILIAAAAAIKLRGVDFILKGKGLKPTGVGAAEPSASHALSRQSPGRA